MASIQDNKLPSSTMTDEAFDLLLSYYPGVHEIVKRMTKIVAAKHKSFCPNDPDMLLVTQEHVKEAGDIIVEKLKELTNSNEFSAEFTGVDDLATFGE